MKVIVFHSYKGGTGKTTLALNTALNMAKLGYKTLCIDADLNAPTFDSIFIGLNPKARFNDLFEKDTENTNDPPPTPKDLILKSTIHPNLDLIFAEPKPKFGEGLLSMDKNFHAKSLKKLYELKEEYEKLGYDYLIMDTSPSLNLASINGIIIADATVIVIRPNRYGISGTTFLIKELYSLLGNIKRKDYIIFNQVVRGTPPKMVSQWKKHFKKRLDIDTIAVIHCNCNVALNMLFSKLIIEDDTKDKEFAKAIEEITQTIISDLENQ